MELHPDDMILCLYTAQHPILTLGKSDNSDMAFAALKYALCDLLNCIYALLNNRRNPLSLGAVQYNLYKAVHRQTSTTQLHPRTHHNKILAHLGMGNYCQCSPYLVDNQRIRFQF